MKKLVRFSVGLILVIVLSACGSSVSKDDLQDNDWIVYANKSSDSDDVDVIFHFTDHTVSMKIDSDSMETSATDEIGELGEDMAKAIIDQLAFTFEYDLEGNTFTLTDTESKAKNTYNISNDGKNIALEWQSSTTTSGMPSALDDKKIILEPYTAKKTAKKVSASSSSTSEESSSSSSKESSGSSAESSESAPVASLSDFVGGWGVPASDAIFIVNSDGSISTPQIGVGLVTSYPETLDFSSDSLGRPIMTYYLNGANHIITKETDGSVTSDGQNYQTYDTSQLTDSPQQTNSVVPYSNDSPQQPDQLVEEYTQVGVGEGFPQISARTGVPVDTILQLNGLQIDSMIMQGQTLRIK